MKKHVKAKEIKPDEVFKAAHKDDEGDLSQSEFVEFVKDCDGCELEAAQIEAVFADIAGGETMSKDSFEKLLAVRVKVVKETLLSSGFPPGDKDNKTMRKLTEGETAVLLEGPLKDDKKLTRIRVKTEK